MRAPAVLTPRLCSICQSSHSRKRLALSCSHRPSSPFASSSKSASCSAMALSISNCSARHFLSFRLQDPVPTWWAARCRCEASASARFHPHVGRFRRASFHTIFGSPPLLPSPAPWSSFVAAHRAMASSAISSGARADHQGDAQLKSSATMAGRQPC